MTDIPPGPDAQKQIFLTELLGFLQEEKGYIKEELDAFKAVELISATLEMSGAELKNKLTTLLLEYQTYVTHPAQSEKELVRNLAEKLRTKLGELDYPVYICGSIITDDQRKWDVQTKVTRSALRMYLISN